MGIFGALNTAVSGLRAQSYAMENISGNIANSQTIGFKRTETSFVDLVVDRPMNQTLSGSVRATGVQTNAIQGDISPTGIATNMAISGSGFFAVQQLTGFQDNRPIFETLDMFTRRGDFALNKDGYLVNGAGYYLKGDSINPATGQVTSINGVVRISDDTVPARRTEEIAYRAILPSQPATNAAREAVPGSELLGLEPGVAVISDPGLAPADARTIDLSGVPVIPGTTYTLSLGTTTFNHEAVTTSDNLTEIFRGLVEADTDYSAEIADGTLVVTAGAGAQTITFLDDYDGLVPYRNDPRFAGDGVVLGADRNAFLDRSISGGSTTVYNQIGNPIDLQLRWAKTASDPSDQWELYYQANGNAGPEAVAWVSLGPTSFDAIGNAVNRPSYNLLGPGGAPATVDGVLLENIRISFDPGGLRQFSTSSGLLQGLSIQQDGYASGALRDVSVSSDGRIMGSYTNGQTLPIARVSIAQFNAPNALKALDGGAFAETLESGAAVITTAGMNLIAGSVELSNADIAEEFTKMIVTQQAYSANTRVVTTAQQMMEATINMVR